MDHMHIPFTSRMLDKMPEAALENIIVIISLEDGDLAVSSLAQIQYEDEDLRMLRPSQALKAYIGDTSGNRCQILGVYGTGSWYPTSIIYD